MRLKQQPRLPQPLLPRPSPETCLTKSMELFSPTCAFVYARLLRHASDNRCFGSSYLAITTGDHHAGCTEGLAATVPSNVALQPGELNCELATPCNNPKWDGPELDHDDCNNGAVIVAPLACLKPSCVNNISVEGADNHVQVRHAEKAFVFVKGTKPTTLTPKGDQFEIVSSNLLDLLNPDAPPKYIFSGFAEQGEFLNYLINKDAALVLLSGVPADPNKDAFTVHSVERVEPANVEKVLQTMQHLMRLSTGAPTDTRKRAMSGSIPTLTEKKHRTLSAWPSNAPTK